MKKILISLSVLSLLSACGVGADTDKEEGQNTEPEIEETDKINEENIEEDESSENKPEDTSKSNVENADENILSEYTTEQIEYARVWLNFGPNPEIEELYYDILPAGTPINPDVEGSATYPEDVVRLYGGRRVDGVITYSGNGDGTINIYNIPYSWDMNDDIEDEVYITESEKALKDIQTDYVEPMEDEEIVEIINKLQ